MTAEERRARIFEEAVEAFANKGYQATTVREISSAAGITQPVFYDHFQSKQELFEEILNAGKSKLFETTNRTIQGGGTPYERLKNSFDQFFKFVEEQPALARLLFSGVNDVPELADLHEAVQREASQQIVAILQTMITREIHRTGDEYRFKLQVEFVKHGMHGLAEWWWNNPDVPREDLVEAVIDLFWFGVQDWFEE